MDNPFIGSGSELGYPAPYWFIVFFKVLGFTLHMVPMNLWYAGLIIMLLLNIAGGRHAKRLSERVINAMPIIVAMGINFGIIPLLFIQVADYRVFYPATILMAWPWFAVILLLMVAYYGVYIYVIGLRRSTMSRFKQTAGWVAAITFVVLGFIYANAFSLMTNIDAWKDLWLSANVGGAPLGIGLNLGDATLFPRWLMVFSIAVTTTAAYVVVDTGFFAGDESREYKEWALGFALKLYTGGLIAVAVTGSAYIFLTIPAAVRAQLMTVPLLILTLLTGAAGGLPWLLIVYSRQRFRFNRGMAFLVGLTHFGVLGFHAVSRQVVQNLELAPYLDVTAEPVNLQLSPMIVFLVLFVAGVGVVVWMVSQVVKANRPVVAEQ
ncbi:MAG: hypothetical protein JXB30_18805 [Anaerolineae bacterium]|nr:hypothetical protein [Anaerolineae bacterium]